MKLNDRRYTYHRFLIHCASPLIRKLGELRLWIYCVQTLPELVELKKWTPEDFLKGFGLKTIMTLPVVGTLETTASHEMISPAEKDIFITSGKDTVAKSNLREHQLKSSLDKLSLWQSAWTFRKAVLIAGIAGFSAVTDGECTFDGAF